MENITLPNKILRKAKSLMPSMNKPKFHYLSKKEISTAFTVRKDRSKTMHHYIRTIKAVKRKLKKNKI